jgi:ParB-like chromosome segregation protein Spo0J
VIILEFTTIRLDQITWDLQERINPDLENLKKSIESFGLIDPLIVEGPNEEDKYYLIHGYRRYLVLKQLKKKDSLISVRVIGKPTSKLERETKRFHIQNTSKKIIGAEEQFLIEQIQKEGNYTDEDIVQLLNPKKNRIKRMKKSRSIDEKLRKEVAKARGSQHALEVIYSLDISEKERNRLYRYLLNRTLTGDHADALWRVHNHELFSDLNDYQKSEVINRTLRQTKFTKREAELLIITELMKVNPNLYQEYAPSWINYVCHVLEEYTQFIHPDLKNYANEFQRKRLRSSLGKLNHLLSWTWKRGYGEEASDIRTDNRYAYETENTEKGYRFRRHKY